MAPPVGQQRVSRPVARYRPGKAPVPGAPDLSDSDYDENELRRQEEEEEAQQITSLSQGTAAALAAKRKTAGIIISTSDESRKVNLKLQQKQQQQQQEEEGSSEYETDSDQDQPPPPHPRKIGTIPSKKEQESSDEYETDLEEEDEGSSEEDEQPAPLLKPVFVPKRQRATINDAEAATKAAEEEERRAAEQAEERRKESHRIAADRIRKELAEKEHEEAKPDLDDTDGLDPDAEFAAWRIRELERIKRDRDAAAEKRKEKEQVERRREMPEALRLKEDVAHAKQSRAEKQRGSQGFMQKYYHKGSFFQDMDILKRDYSEKTESQVDVSKLPKMMQVRNYGKASRSKWTHLANEDTSRLAQDFKQKGGQGCFNCGGAHLKRDCPQGASGANAAPLAEPRHQGEPHGRGDRREHSHGDDRDARRHRDYEDRETRRYRDDRDRDRHRDREYRDRDNRHRDERTRRRSRSRTPERREEKRSRRD